MNYALTLFALTIIVQWCFIYALINRLMKQAGQKTMSAVDVLRQAEKLIVEQKPDTEKKDEREKLQRFGRKIGSTGAIDPVPSYMQQAEK